MKLSVIVPCYKFKNYITQSIDSILSQNINFEMEVLVRDDGSNDGTIELIQEKYKNIIILNSEQNLGVVDNLLSLLSNCNGEYIAYLDGDDFLSDNNYYQRAVNFLDQNKEFSMYSSGYRYIENEIIHPTTGWLVSNKKITEQKDLLIENYISFARVFRKFKIYKTTFENIVYPDWVFNFECLRYGKSYNDTENCVGLYRLHDGGMFSKTQNIEKIYNKEKMKIELTNRFNSKEKVITILDCFVHNQFIKEKLFNFVNWLSEDNHDIALISNTIVEEKILKSVKYYIYDKRNQLFKEEYTNLPCLDIYRFLGENLELHDISFSLQKHGLSVLINLFNILKFAKEQGYTHFQRFEVDSIFGKKSRDFIKSIPDECKSKNKKGMFYFNHRNAPPDISFHYFYCEIDYFLNKVKNIKCEQDYVEYLNDFYKNKDFKIVETFIYDHLMKNNDNLILEKPGFTMNLDFPDVIWNTESSVGNYETKYNGCTTKLYKNKFYDLQKKEFNFNGEFTLLSYSHVDKIIERKIVVEYENGDIINFDHKTFCNGFWQFHNLPSNIKLISVYENDKLLYTEQSKNCISYIIYR